MTYPLIGNYGISLESMESEAVRVKGFIVREGAKKPSHWQCEMNLDGFLKQHKIMAIEGIDTRALTKAIRRNGALNGIITAEDLSAAEIKKYFDGFNNLDAVKQVTTDKSYQLPGTGKRVAVLDFGVKQSILRSLHERNCHLTIYPAFATAEEILSSSPDGILLSNGPGDPKDIPTVLETVKSLLGKKPMFGICLGHQLLALSLGADTEKLKFGHRGCNHPVKDLLTGRVCITSQNHSYVVKQDSMPRELLVTHVSLNDGSIEGLRHKDLQAFSVQFHPEASPGPKENAYLFDRFIKLMEGNVQCQEITV
jgi:carbamoyl-phosphate synthase small subunit